MGLKITFRGLVRFMLMRGLEISVLLAILVLLPNLPPFCKFEKSYKVPATLPLTGSLAINEKLNKVEHWHRGDFKGPEAFAIYNDEIYTSLHSGEIVKLSGLKHITPVVSLGKPCEHEFEEKICGRPLGITFDNAGNLYAADAYYGIYKINLKTGDKIQLISPDIEIDGKKPRLFNSIALSSSGDIYWSDSSTNFALEDGLFELISDGSGRLLHYNPKTRRHSVLIDDLHFANGVILSENEDYVLVSETGRSRIHKYHLKGSKAGKQEIFLEGLPGITDNLTPDGKGGYIVPLVNSHDSRNPSPFQIFGPFPWIRKLIGRILALIELPFVGYDYVYPNNFAKMGKHFIGHFSSTNLLTNGTRVTILHVSGDGKILDSIHAMNGRLTAISEARIHKNELLLGSPFNDYIGKVNLNEIGWSHLVEVPKPKSTEVPKPKPTEAPTPKPTQPPTPKPTEAPKPKPTEAPKPKPTEAPKPKPTEAPTPRPTEAPKPKPTEAPKVAPTEAPAQKQVPPTAQNQAPPAAAQKQAPPPPAAQKQAPPPPPPAAQKQAPPPPPPAAQKQAPPPPPTQAPKPQTPPPTQAKPAAQVPQTKESQQPSQKEPPKTVPVTPKN